ncbi:hypothetical protein HGRIS_008685 [Hohenbuehelia grisea]|uniref:Uncharacterized protein n=1 Tax=Hohenbuehelia grisea TaxID=104357 RepID=A0ABR3J9A3_9AGAR
MTADRATTAPQSFYRASAMLGPLRRMLLIMNVACGQGAAQHPSTTILFDTLMSRSITVSYKLQPPAGVETRNLQTEKEMCFEVAAEPAANDSQGYYTALRAAVEDARNRLGDDLTAWRDAVGKKELSKETKKSMKYGVEDEEEDEE